MCNDKTDTYDKIDGKGGPTGSFRIPKVFGAESEQGKCAYPGEGPERKAKEPLVRILMAAGQIEYVHESSLPVARCQIHLTRYRALTLMSRILDTRGSDPEQGLMICPLFPPQTLRSQLHVGPTHLPPKFHFTNQLGDELRPVGIAKVVGRRMNSVGRLRNLVANRSDPGGEPLAYSSRSSKMCLNVQKP